MHRRPGECSAALDESAFFWSVFHWLGVLDVALLELKLPLLWEGMILL